MNYLRHHHTLWLLSVLLLTGCANMKPPEGGPIDRSTPEIVSSYPDSTNLINFHDNKIRLEFDRYVNERSVEEAVFISPHIGDMEFDWSGRDVEIQLSDKLRSNTTYVMNIGTDVEDLNKNRMARAFTIAFSTGKEIDRGAIEGCVYPGKSGMAPSGIMIFAYRLDGINPDTLNPVIDKPDFITQTGKDGEFFLRYIPFGNYRIIAVRDEYRNLIYDRETDEYGVPSGMISLTSSAPLVQGVLMKLAKEDTTGPRLVKIMVPNRNHIVAEFSEPIRTDSISLTSFSAIDTVRRIPLELIRVYPTPAATSSMTFVCQRQDSGSVYRLTAANIVDSAGNTISPLANSLLFRSALRLDTTSARLVSVSIRDSIQSIDRLPVLTLTFSDALAKSTSLDFLTLLNNEGQPVPSIRKQLSDVSFSLQPEHELANRTWYRLRATCRDLRDWAGRICRDSTKSWRFETLDIEDLSTVEGTVTDHNRTDTLGCVYVTAIQVGSTQPRRYIVAADATGTFLFQNIAEGQYVFQSFRDRNNNGRQDPGKPFPFQYAERFSPFSDTVKVRARWPLEGVMLVLP